MEKDRNDAEKGRLLQILSRHIGREHAIAADLLCEQVFGKPVTHKINDTKPLRNLIRRLRLEGTPIGSSSAFNGGGYYLMTAGSEATDMIDGLKRRGLASLYQAAKLEQISLPDLLGHEMLRLEGEVGRCTK